MFDKEVKFTVSHNVLLYILAITSIVDFILDIIK